MTVRWRRVRGRGAIQSAQQTPSPRFTAGQECSLLCRTSPAVLQAEDSPRRLHATTRAKQGIHEPIRGRGESPRSRSRSLNSRSSSLDLSATSSPSTDADLFTEVPDTFAPVERIPVGPDYTIGPGDEILIAPGDRSARTFTLQWIAQDQSLFLKLARFTLQDCPSLNCRISSNHIMRMSSATLS